jgi:hypothetical protein
MSFSICVHPDYQNKAVTAVIFSEYYHTFKKEVENCFRTPELRQHSIHNLWKHFNTEINCRRKLSG